MHRTDTDMLDFVLPLIAGRDTDDLELVQQRVQRLTGALMLGMHGRVALDAAMGALMFEPGEALPAPTALDLVGAEMARVRTIEGYTAETDDLYNGPYLAEAAAVYITPVEDRDLTVWPFDLDAYKPAPFDRVRELVKGASLALFEIERLLRNPSAPYAGKPHDDNFTVRDEIAEPAVAADSPRVERAEDDPVEVLLNHSEVYRQSAETVFALGEPVRLAIGDRVRIARKGAGWTGWVPSMDTLIGRETLIVSLADWDVPVAGLADAEGFAFPLSCLDRVDG